MAISPLVASVLARAVSIRSQRTRAAGSRNAAFRARAQVQPCETRLCLIARRAFGRVCVEPSGEPDVAIACDFDAHARWLATPQLEAATPPVAECARFGASVNVAIAAEIDRTATAAGEVRSAPIPPRSHDRHLHGLHRTCAPRAGDISAPKPRSRMQHLWDLRWLDAREASLSRVSGTVGRSKQ